MEQVDPMLGLEPLDELVNNPLPSCAVCHKLCRRVCPDCNLICYCSDNCRDEDILIHAILCTTQPKMRSLPRPGLFRVFYFPEDRFSVKVFWLPIRIDPTTGRKVTCNLNYLFEKRHFLAPLTLTRIGDTDLPLGRYIIRSRKRADGLDVLGHERLVLMFRRDFLVDGHSRQNLSLITATGGMMAIDWKGPMLVMAQERDGEPEDVLMPDLRFVAEQLKSKSMRVWMENQLPEVDEEIAEAVDEDLVEEV